MNKKGHLLNGILLALGLAYIRFPLGDQALQADLLTLLEDMVRLLPPVVLGAMLPDIDTEFGKHRKTLHNLPILVGFIAYPYYFEGNLEFVWIGILTHFVLDLLGSRRGIALFYPLSSNETSFPLGVKTSSKYADLMTVVITAFELTVFALFAIVIFPNFDFQLEAVNQAIGAL